MRGNLFQKQGEKCNIYKHALSQLHIFDRQICLISIMNDFHRIRQKIELKAYTTIYSDFEDSNSRKDQIYHFFLSFFSVSTLKLVSLKSHHLNRNATRGIEGNRKPRIHVHTQSRKEIAQDSITHKGKENTEKTCCKRQGKSRRANQAMSMNICESNSGTGKGRRGN